MYVFCTVYFYSIFITLLLFYSILVNIYKYACAYSDKNNFYEYIYVYIVFITVQNFSLKLTVYVIAKGRSLGILTG